jgi:putative tryptophan/tyrosine transport system substrate-binding protein
MRRRDFIAIFGSVAIAWSRSARAVQRTMPVVGYVWIGTRGSDKNVQGLLQGLADKGYVIGQNLVFEERFADGDAERIGPLIAELLMRKLDVLVTPGTTLTRAAQSATKSVPIVCVTSNPVASGLVASLSHPGGNITGLSLLSGDHSTKWLELLKEAVPKLHRVAVLRNPDNTASAMQVDQMKEAARSLGLDLTVITTRPQEIDASFTAISSAGVEGLIVTDDPTFDLLAARIIAFTAERRLPALYGFSPVVQQGALMSYSANYFAMWRRAANYVDRILKGQSPADLPIEQASEVALDINLRTAKALGLTIPTTLLAFANEVIE